MTNKQLSQFFGSFAASTFVFGLMAVAANAQVMVHRTATGVTVTKVCAKEAVNIRQSIVTDNPIQTMTAFPVSQRPVVGTLRRNQCRYLSDSEAQYWPDGGYTWVNLSTGGWVASEFLTLYQEEVDVD